MRTQELKLDDPEKYFLMGLIHDIGKALLLKSFTDVSQSQTMNIDLVKANIEENHLSLGASLLKRWAFGNEFLQVILHHEDTEFSPETNKEILVKHLANLLTRKTGYSFFDDESELAELDSAKLLELDPTAFNSISEEVKTIVDDLKNVL